MLARPRRFGRADVVERTVVRGPHPVAVFEAGSLDVAYGLAMSGRTNGRIRIGEPSSPNKRASGELGPKQFFRGQAPLAIHAADRKGFNQALPNTHGPITQPNAVTDLLARIPPNTFMASSANPPDLRQYEA
jgi:hypothetical protein